MARGVLKDRLRAGEVVHGLLSPNVEMDLVETLGSLGFDLYILDAEHGTAGPREAAGVVRACEAAGLAPLVRPRGLDAK
ncbi:MAG: siderophore biosynthesis protein SbnG, partial [Thermoanaerobaculia bacterium]